MNTQETSNSSFGNVRTIGWLAGLLLCVAFAFTHSFSNMAKYDDESYVMMTIKTFLDGDRLYEETFSQYGPAYYMIQQPIHGWMGIPVTHDIVRLKTIGCWMFLGMLAGFVVTRLTGKSLAGLTAMLFSVLYLQKLGLEPAHPQDVVAVLAMVCLALMSCRNRSVLFLVGLCAALAGLTKLNVGASTAAACLFAAGFSRRDSIRFNRLMAVAGALVAIAVSSGVFLTIAKKNIESGQWEMLAWPAIILYSTVLVCAVASQHKSAASSNQNRKKAGHRSHHPALAVALGGVTGSLFVVGWAIAHGNSIYEILHGVLLQHSAMLDSIYHPMSVHFGTLPFVAVAALLLPVRFLQQRSGTETIAIDRILLLMPPFVLATAIIQVGIDCCQPLIHGLMPRGAASFLVTVGPILAPILLLRKTSQLRLALAMTACLSPILAFPVPGTQINLGTLPILLGLIVASFDVCEFEIVPSEMPRILCEKAAPIVALLIVLATCVFGVRWLNNTPLDQPGCRWVRIEPVRAAQEIAVADCIRNIDTEWLAFDKHNHNRFFFWTEKKPLTSLTPTFWPAFLTEKQQEKVVRAASSVDSICVVKLQDQGLNLSDYAPSVERALFESPQLIEEIGRWQIGLKLNGPVESENEPATSLSQTTR